MAELRTLTLGGTTYDSFAGATQKEWELIEDLTLEEDVASVSWDLSEHDYKEVWIDGVLSVVNSGDSAATLRLVVGRTSGHNVISRDITSVAVGTTTIYLRTHGYISPTKRLIHELSTSRYKYIDSAIHRNAGDATSTERTRVSAVMVSCSVAAGENPFAFGSGTSFKVWGR